MSTLVTPAPASTASPFASEPAPAAPAAPGAVVDLTADASTGAFLAALRPHGARPLVFEYAGPDGALRRVEAGYHVTEIKDVTVRSVDCGGGAAQAWRETVVQVWDVPGDADARYMSVDKFFGIWRAVDKQLQLANDARLVVEAGDDLGAAVHYAATAIMLDGDAEGGAVVVRLGARRASCKPRDQYYAERGEAKPARPRRAGALPMAAGGADRGASACCTPQDGAPSSSDAASGEAPGAPCCG